MAKTDRRDFGRWSRALGSRRNGFEVRRVFKGQVTGGTQSETSSPAADSTAHELRRMWEDFDRISPRHLERSDCREKSPSDWRDDGVVIGVKDALQRHQVPSSFSCSTDRPGTPDCRFFVKKKKKKKSKTSSSSFANNLLMTRLAGITKIIIQRQ